MKLLFCGHCNDVVRLFPEPRYCKCGKSWGQYLPDNSTTIQTSYTASIGVANPDFSQALDTLMADRDHFSPLLAIRAWLNPDSESDVRYIAEDVTPEQAARPKE